MEELQTNTAEMITAGQAMLTELQQLAVAYSFSVLGAIILLIIGYIAANLLERSVYSGMKRFRGFDETLRKFFSKIVRYAVLVLVGVTVLAQFGVQTASIIAALGAIGLAIGLALQGTLQNIAAGIMLLVLRPFRVGEAITAGGISGTVEEIGLFATELKTADGLYVLAPNSQLWGTPVTNFSRNATRSNDLAVGISYRDDIQLAQATMLKLVGDDERVLEEPAPAFFVSQLADNSIIVTTRYWTSSANWWQTKLDLTKAVRLTFDAKGISVPLPQQQVLYVPTETPKAAPSKTASPRTASRTRRPKTDK
ncbi:mechanosensitive ion channel domain-containing protein [Aquamicrobium sp. LC103]|uniref:mechanosensitive ion channel family protein n=1 Tax=Aquamicrobium sp. LC103 TaxID=1120658 RepID=UPI00063E87FB|nr:mechanosensitive ion channel domain-containing protein [Aquamicrobium sp. LC103]TKT81310.1 mechanosensitive ion channel [Aquamicrobium sp. LC103]